MNRTVLAAALSVIAAAPAFATSTFQQTCSNIEFKYNAQGQATISATCLRADGSPNATSLAIQGVSNNNGTLTRVGGASTFQKSCGNITIAAKDANMVSLSALCRSSSGASNSTSIQLNGIKNINGVLSY
jgi:hypothetical protein